MHRQLLKGKSSFVKRNILLKSFILRNGMFIFTQENQYKIRYMSEITKEQYEFALERIEELLPYVGNDVPMSDKHMIEMDIVSDIVCRYEKTHYPIGKPTLGEIIVDALETQGMTAKELARQLGISAPRISAFIHGKSEPSLKIARELCKVLHLTPAQVLGVE